MKKIFLMLVSICVVLISCKTNQNVAKVNQSLEGTWHLNYISGPRISFDGLYAVNVPNITFDLKESRFSGSNSCNRFSGSFVLDGNKISFKDDKTAMTMMACEGNGDKVFMATLPKIDSYTIVEGGNTLQFFMGKVIMMRFDKKTAE